MILTGPRIEQLVDAGEISIDPFDQKLVGPNSVDLRLDRKLKVYGATDARDCVVSPDPSDPLDMKKSYPTTEIDVDEDGWVLRPGMLYLGRTIERVGSERFVPMVEGRSSCGRLGLQIHMTAGFCDTGFFGTITLEMTAVHPLRIYAGVPVCQVFFTKPEGEIRLYKGRYQGQVEATASRMHEKREGAGR